MKLIRKRGSTSNILRVFLRDSSSTTGAGKTALDHTAAGLNISVIADNEAAPTTYTSAGSTIEAVTTLGTFLAPSATKCRFKKIDDTNMPGVYELQLADARFAVASSKSIQGMITATGVVPLPFEIDLEPGTQIDDIDNFVDTEMAAANTSLASIITLIGSPDNGSLAADNINTFSLLDGISTQLETIDDFVDTEVAAIVTAVNTINSKLGAITGSGQNTVLGYFQSTLRKDVTVSSDIGGTYDDATDSLQALKDILGDPDNGTFATDIAAIASTTNDINDKVDTIDNFIDTEIAALTTTLSTVNSKLGAFTGSGVNTLLGCIRAICATGVSIPTDITSAGAFEDNSLQDIGTILRSDDFEGNLSRIHAEVVDTDYSAFTLHELTRIAAAGAAGKTAGGGSGTETFYDVGLGTIRIIVSTISGGNRSAVTYPFTT